MESKQTRLTDAQAVEIAKIEAKHNLSGEDLEKCLTALDNWLKNYSRE